MISDVAERKEPSRTLSTAKRHRTCDTKSIFVTPLLVIALLGSNTLSTVNCFPLLASTSISDRRRGEISRQDYPFSRPNQPRRASVLDHSDKNVNKSKNRATADLEEAALTIFTNADPNDNRYAASDWLQNMRSMPKSTILKAIRGPILAVVTWSTFVSLIYKLAMARDMTNFASHLCLSSRPHSFLVSALGLLLVFRTNSAYQRFAEGRKIWERIHSESRNLSRLAILYSKEIGEARINRVFRLLAAYPYLLHQHIRNIQPKSDPKAKNASYGLNLPDRRGFRNVVRRNSTMRQFQNSRGKDRTKNRRVDNAPTHYWVDRRKLPWCLFPPKALDRCVHSSNRPLWVCDRLSQEMTQVEYTDNFTSRERLQFLSQIGKLSQAIGQCERIHQTAVPLNYARHSLRSVTLWLFTLPFSLVEDFGLLTGPVMGLAAWLLYGIYQIGYTIEDPFQGSLRLSNLCDAICRDVMYGTNQMNRRMTAFGTLAEDDEDGEEWAELDRHPTSEASTLVSRVEEPVSDAEPDYLTTIPRP